MITQRHENGRDTIEFQCTEMLVPKDHLLRKIDAAIDLSQIYGIVKELYCADNGRPSVDPVVLYKIVLIEHLYGIRSMRQTIADIEMNIAYRWFLVVYLDGTHIKADANMKEQRENMMSS